ncbi:MAG: VanW family protein [Clostridia bacterium]|nr:VanW family protein [Clostridia bacterium]
MNQILYVQKAVNENKIILMLFLLLILFVSFFFAVININNENIISRVSINNVDLSDLSKEEAMLKLQEKFNFINSTETIDIYVNDKKYTTQIDSLGITPNYEAMVNNAYEIGRTNNILVNNYKILQSYIWGYNLAPQLEINDEMFNIFIASISKNISESKIDDSYVITNTSIDISIGKNGIAIDKEQLKDDIIKYLLSDNRKSTLTASIEQMENGKIDFDALYTEIHSEPVNASSKTENGTLVFKESSNGITFNLEDAKFLYTNTLEKKISIPLIITQPEITTDSLSNEIFKDVLSTYTTKYKESEKNRTVNVKLSASKINGTILLPGQEFSYNNVVGERTFENGFKVATIFANNSHQQGLGGGICQTSSTLYNAVLYSNLEVTNRANHQLLVSYVPLGQDATVAWPYTDLKFKNNRTTPIKIVAEAKDGKETVSILGIAATEDYEVTIKSVTLSSKAYAIEYIDDATMNEGEESVVQYGTYGYTIEVYKILSKDGIEISNTLISTDKYNPLKKIVKIGTAPVTPDEPTTPTEPTDPVIPPEEPIDEPTLPPGWDVPENPLI